MAAVVESSSGPSTSHGGLFKRIFGNKDSGATRSAPRKGKEPAGPIESASTGPPGVFGVALDSSLRYASVAISQVDADGKARVYGHVPVVVAKTGLFLKENGTTTPGIFRVSGSNKRIKELEQIFNTPPMFGKDMTWQNYSVHDAASAFRRYLNQLPSPIIPFSLYRAFHEAKPKEPTQSEVDAAIKRYRDLIKELPPSAQHLLFYILDLLSMFHAKSSENLMPASNLALIFQPGLLRAESSALTTSVSHGPDGSGGTTGDEAQALIATDEVERKKSQDVLQFLIENASSFELEAPVSSKRGKRISAPSRSASSVRLASLAAAITPSRTHSYSNVPTAPSRAVSGPEATPAMVTPDDAARRKARRQSADQFGLKTPEATGLKRSNSDTSRPSRSPRIPEDELPPTDPVPAAAVEARKRGWFGGKKRQSVQDPLSSAAASPPKA